MVVPRGFDQTPSKKPGGVDTIRTFQLNIYAPVLVNAGAFLADVTEAARPTWRRSVRAKRGPWLGTFRMYGEEYDLRKWFNEGLACHVEERYLTKTWEGLIWEMEYTSRGITRRRSLDTVKNAVKGVYTDTSGAVAETSWSTQDQSLGIYGRMEEIIIMDNYPQATVEGRRDKLLAEAAWPVARPVGGRAHADTYLDVSVAGYIFTANNKFVTSADGSTGNVSTWVNAIASADLEFLTVGKIEQNTFQVKQELSTPARAGDVLFEMADLGDSSLTPWRAYADLGRLIHYGPMSKTPLYFLREGAFFTDSAMKQSVAPWEMVPGVVRDMEYPVRGKEQGSWLDDARDMLVEEVTASQNGVSWSTEDFSEAELLAAQDDYAAAFSDLEQRL